MNCIHLILGIIIIIVVVVVVVVVILVSHNTYSLYNLKEKYSFISILLFNFK